MYYTELRKLNFVVNACRRWHHGTHVLYTHVASNLRGRRALDTLCCPRHPHSAPLGHGNIPGASVHGVCGDHSVCVACPFRRRWHRNDVCAVSVCGQLEHRCRLAEPLRDRRRTFKCWINTVPALTTALKGTDWEKFNIWENKSIH